MVERLKDAVEKARARRARVTKDGPAAEGGSFLGARVSAPRGERTDNDPLPGRSGWQMLETVELSPPHLRQNRIITHGRDEPAHIAFDLLRTRTLSAFSQNGWSRLGITSPTKGCGKTFVAANLALSMSRQADRQTVLMDMDLRAPSLAKVLGVARPEPISWFLKKGAPVESYFRRYGANLALGFNSEKISDPAETIAASSTRRALEDMQQVLMPDIIIYDLPPVLVTDDVLGFLPQLDAVLLVAGGGQTEATEVVECEQMLADQTHLLGVLLNKAEDANKSQYGYEDG